MGSNTKSNTYWWYDIGRTTCLVQASDSSNGAYGYFNLTGF